MQSTLTKHQEKLFIKKIKGADFIVTLRYDDRCGNGHNTFSITAEHANTCGCMHDMIVKEFPELQKFIKWHLCGSDGPVHYIANTLYFAGDRDCWGTRKGEQQISDRTGLPMWQLESLPSDVGLVYSTSQPEPVVLSYAPILGEGKNRDLDAARKSAIWPEATDEELCSDNLEELLKARLPALLEDFRKDMEGLGFVY
jgi:hypothetical protein